MANFIFNGFKKYMADSGAAWVSSTVKVLLVHATNDADRDDTYVGDIGTLGELLTSAGTGYSRKTLAATSLTATRDDANDVTILDADDPSWTTLDEATIQAAIIYIFVTNDSDSVNVAYIDTGGFPFVTNGGTFTIQFNSGGIIQVS